MLFKPLTPLALAVGLPLCSPQPVAAQSLETLGTRAAALGAFVAVADDASAVAWNPSGFVSGPIFNIVIDFGRATNDEQGLPAGRLSGRLLALGTTPLGLGYYRLQALEVPVDGSAVNSTPNRQEGQVLVRRLVSHHFGASVQQSLGNHVTVGATLKLVRGGVGEARLAPSSSQLFEDTEALELETSTTGDIDAGVMLSAGRVRAGLLVRNLTTPTFGEGTAAVTMPRHARLGLAWGDRWPGLSSTVIAVDADLTRVSGLSGERRDIAAGLERWIGGRRGGVRGGVRVSTVGERRPVATLGASYAARSGVYIDGYVGRGSQDARFWGLATRFTY